MNYTTTKGKVMAVANVTLKLQYPEGTEKMSTVYGQTVHHLYMSGEENPTNRMCEHSVNILGYDQI
jgi:hypothetical protein